MRYAPALISALLLGGATATLALQPGAAQTAQNDPSQMAQVAPRAGAPTSFADLVAKLTPAVVNISTTQKITQRQPANPFAGTPFEGMFGQMQGQGGAPVTREAQSLGSGFLISADGYVVTNNHVIAPGMRGASVESITVTLADHKEYKARLIGRDSGSDLALLKITPPGPLPFVRFGDSTRARVGDWVVAIGQPFGFGGTVTAGIVSGLNRTSTLSAGFDRFIQTDAAINQGNSGGPMFNLAGDVIGINSQILGGSSGGNIGIGFAIPAEVAKPVIDTLMKGGTVRRGYLGVAVTPLDDDSASALGLPKDRGELVQTVEPGGPAAKAGLRPSDVVTRVNGKPVTVDQNVSLLIANVAPGSPVRLDVIRDNRPLALNAVAGTRPAEEQIAGFRTEGGDDDGDGIPDDDQGGAQVAPSRGSIGISVQPLTPQIAQAVGVDSTVQGVVVTSVDPASDAGQKVKRGDVIQSVNSTPVRSAADFARGVSAAKAAGRPQVLLLVNRGRGNAVFIPVKIK